MLLSCVTLQKLPNFSEPWFPHLWKWSSNLHVYREGETLFIQSVYHVVSSQYMIATNTAIIKGPAISGIHRTALISGGLTFAFVEGFEDILIFFWCLKLLQQSTPDYSTFLFHGQWKEVWYKSWVFHCECNNKHGPYLQEQWIPGGWGEVCF